MFVPVGQQVSVEQSPYPMVRADARATAVSGLVRADARPTAVTGLGGCGCSGIRSVGHVNPDGLGVSPDGLGGDGPALFASVTGNALLDGVLGGALGWFMSPNPNDRVVWAAGGAAAAALAGTLGIVASVGAAIYVRKPRAA